MDHDVVDQGADRQSRAGAFVGAAPFHVADLERSVGSRACAAADTLDGEKIVAHRDTRGEVLVLTRADDLR
ncbi:MAG: hypothetical protein M3P18_11960 [Actinomycetota bacterium]|nr:hypothetical protein [Actinomycetota bacterium]